MARQHGNKLVTGFFKELERLGFEVLRKTNGGWVIVPPKTNSCQQKYHTHGTLKGLTPLRKDIVKLYGIKLPE
jgi:hypothetical protein